MTPTRKKSIADNIRTGVMVAGIMGVIYLVIDMRDFVKYKQPEVDRGQNEAIQRVHDRATAFDSMSCEKNKAVNMRIDATTDINRQILDEIKDIKMQNVIILKHNRDAQNEYNNIKKLLHSNNIADEAK